MDEIRAEQTHINTNPQRHTHTRVRTQTHVCTRTLRGKEENLQKTKGERRKSAEEAKSEKSGRRKNPSSYKQVKSDAASLASQHRHRWHTELRG